MSKSLSDIEYEIKPKNSFSLGIEALWQYRELFLHFTKRDLKVRYRHAALGILWAILQPLLLMLVFTLFFHKGLSIEGGELPYPIFAFTGLIIWLFFSNGINGAANSLVRHATILNKIYFPRLVLPLSSIATGLLDYLFGWAMLVVLACYFGVEFSFGKIVLFTVLSLLLGILATLSFGLLLAALNAKYRDFQYVLPFALQLLFFGSPVLYDQRHFEGNFIHNLLAINPLAGALHLSRVAWTTAAPDWQLVFQSTFSALFLAALGIYVFRKMEAFFGDLA